MIRQLFAPVRGWDLGLFLPAVGLVIMSGMAMASAATNMPEGLALRHGLWILLGIILSVAVSRTDYRRWADFAILAYGASVAVLVFVLVAGAVRLGATRWLSLFGMSVQPSELAKLTTTWWLARYLAGQPKPLPGRVVWRSFFIVGPPTLLVFLQPDLGSASIFCAIWLGLVWMAGASSRMLAGLGATLLACVPLAWEFVLKDYQRDRLTAFINPHADPLGAGYTVIQSVIAIGSGRLGGRGWFAGTQNQLSFLPEHHSDFIFAVIGEEWGFLGCLALIALFVAFLMRILHIAQATSDPHGRLLAAGIGSWIAYQALINLGMVMGLLPVVGVPLPLVSYGGSSMVTLWAALGLLQSIARCERLA